MADRLTPAELERRLNEIVRRILREHGDDVLATIKRGGNWQRDLDRMYTRMRADLTAEIGPQLRAGVLDSALALMEAERVSVDVAALGNRAAAFSERYTFDLVTGITDTTRDRLGKAMSAYFKDETIDLKALGQRIEWLFGEGRGQTIATTEATRASAQGQVVLADELREENPDAKVVMVWQTSNDEIVCEICGPKNGEQIEGDDVPPAHPNCRCAVRMMVLEVGNATR